MIPLYYANEMLDSLCYRTLIKKRRYRIRHGGLDWLGQEVTGDPPLLQHQSRTESLLDLEGVSASNLAADNRQPMPNDGKQNQTTRAFRSVTKLSAQARGRCLCQNRSAQCP